MKTLIAALAATLALSAVAVAPASAQPYGHHHMRHAWGGHNHRVCVWRHHHRVCRFM